MKVMYSLATVKHKRNKALLQQFINISTVVKDIFLVYIIITHSNYISSFSQEILNCWEQRGYIKQYKVRI